MSIASDILADMEKHLGPLIPTDVNVKGHERLTPPLPDTIDKKVLKRTGNRVIVEFYTTAPKDPKPPGIFRYDYYGEEY